MTADLDDVFAGKRMRSFEIGDYRFVDGLAGFRIVKLLRDAPYAVRQILSSPDKLSAYTARASGPLRRITPIPLRPVGVANATIVSAINY